MSVCEFDFRLPVPAERLLGALRTDFARFGGSLSGSDDGSGFGEFSLPTPLGTFSGVYRVETPAPGSCAVRIELADKPMFVPCSAIGDHLARRLRKAADAA